MRCPLWISVRGHVWNVIISVIPFGAITANNDRGTFSELWLTLTAKC